MCFKKMKGTLYIEDTKGNYYTTILDKMKALEDQISELVKKKNFLSHTCRYSDMMGSLQTYEQRLCYEDRNNNEALDKFFDRFNRICLTFISNIDEYEREAKENFKTNKSFLSKKPLFFTVEKQGEPANCVFAYETGNFNDKTYTIPILSADILVASIRLQDFNLLNNMLRPMTDDEFEHIFLPKRVSLQNFSRENEMIDYDHYLRNLFNQSKKE